MKKIISISVLYCSTYILAQIPEGTAITNTVKNEMGKETEITYIQEGQTRKAKFDYDTAGNRIGSKIYDNFDQKIFESSNTIFEDKSSEIIQQWYKGGEIDTKLFYKLDTNNRIIEIKDYYKDTNSYLFTGYTYVANTIAAADSYFVIAGKRTSIDEIGSMISTF